VALEAALKGRSPESQTRGDGASADGEHLGDLLGAHAFDFVHDEDGAKLPAKPRQNPVEHLEHSLSLQAAFGFGPRRFGIELVERDVLMAPVLAAHLGSDAHHDGEDVAPNFRWLYVGQLLRQHHPDALAAIITVGLYDTETPERTPDEVHVLVHESMDTAVRVVVCERDTGARRLSLARPSAGTVRTQGSLFRCSAPAAVGARGSVTANPGVRCIGAALAGVWLDVAGREAWLERRAAPAVAPPSSDTSASAASQRRRERAAPERSDPDRDDPESARVERAGHLGVGSAQTRRS
jgi:hypothetical protein